MFALVPVCGDKGQNDIQNAKISLVSTLLQIDLFAYACEIM